jgi:hypothetical protein
VFDRQYAHDVFLHRAAAALADAGIEPRLIGDARRAVGHEHAVISSSEANGSSHSRISASTAMTRALSSAVSHAQASSMSATPEYSNGVAFIPATLVAN